MLKYLKKLKKITVLFFKIYILKEFKMIDLWFWENGDNTLRINYPLNEKSLVFDLGGYEGEWTSKIFDMYGSDIWVFEPVKAFFNNLKIRFNDNPKIRIFNCGLSDHYDEVQIYLHNNGTSIYNVKNSNIAEEITLRDVNEFIQENSINTIDLMKINIEGSEYELLESLLEKGNIKKIRNIQVQFHPWIENAPVKREKIRNELKKTHVETYNYPFIWENWKIRE